MAPVSVARWAYDGVSVVGNMIYFVGGLQGGSSGTVYNLTSTYAPEINQWETLNPMSVSRKGVATSSLNGKLYACFR